jgi:hypothetical protein
LVEHAAALLDGAHLALELGVLRAQLLGLAQGGVADL